MKLIPAVLAITILMLLTAPSQAAGTNTTAAPPAPKAGTVGPINMQGMQLSAVLEYYAMLRKRSIITAPGVQGAITFQSQGELTLEEAIQALDSVLAVNGIGVIPMGDKFLKVVQIATAKQEGITVGVLTGRTDAASTEGGLTPLPAADSLVTQIMPLQYADAAEVVTALQPYLHPYGQLIPLAKSNSILITETGANINQMLKIVQYVDQPSALRMETRIFVMKHAKATDVAQRLTQIIQETQSIGARAAAPGQPQPPQPIIRIPTMPTRSGGSNVSGTAGTAAEESVVEGKVVISPDERTNKILILSRPNNFAFFEKVIQELDAKMDPDVITKVVALEYANSEDAASLLNSLITGGSLPTSSRSRTTSKGSSSTTRTSPVPAPPMAIPGGNTGAGSLEGTGFLQFSEGVRILPDARTNSLLLMATKEDLARIEELIKSVDTPVAQVLIEVVIAEVKLANDLEVSVNMFKALGGGTGGVNTSDKAPTVDLRTAAADGTLPTAANLAGGSGLTYWASFRKLKLDAVVRMLSTSSKFKVLSTPVIQTLHNQEASIIVGESRPVPVSTISSIVGNSGTLGTGSLNSNIEYKDIAIELKVTPRINPNGYVTMDIEQKVNDVGGNVPFNGTDVPIITKREAKASVIVMNESTIVLGGLIKEDKTITETKVPFLGDIPFLGTLFKSKGTIKNRNELIVFIRPTVMRNDAEAMAEAVRRSRMLKAGEELELEQRFGTGPGGASANVHSPTSGTKDSTDASESQRRDAKVKALKEQSGNAP